MGRVSLQTHNYPVMQSMMQIGQEVLILTFSEDMISCLFEDLGL